MLCDVGADCDGCDEANEVVGNDLGVCHGVLMNISSRAFMRMVRPRTQNVSSARMFDISGSWGGGLLCFICSGRFPVLRFVFLAL